MTESKTTGDKTISVGKPRLSLKRAGGVERDSVRQTFSHGRTNTVQVERKKRRVALPGEKPEGAPPAPSPSPSRSTAEAAPSVTARSSSAADKHAAARAGIVLRQLSVDEIAARDRALT